MFSKGHATNSVEKRLAENLFEQMVNFAEYCMGGETLILTEEYGLLPIAKIAS